MIYDQDKMSSRNGSPRRKPTVSLSGSFGGFLALVLASAILALIVGASAALVVKTYNVVCQAINCS